MKKLFKALSAALFSAAVALPLLAVTPAFPASAFSAMKSRVYDDFNRPSLGVTEPGQTGAGVEPDESWVHNPDGFVVYWIQYNAATKPSIADGALKFEVTGDDGWCGFGMTGDFKDRDYDSFSVKLKGAKGGEENALYFNIGGVFDFKWDNAGDPDGSALAPITTSWQTYTISMEKSGMGATKAQRNMMNNGWTDFHINSAGGAMTVYIDEIKQVQTHGYRDAVAPPPSVEAAPQEPAQADAPLTPEAENEQPAAPTVGGDGVLETPAATELPSEDVVEEEKVYPATDRPLDNSFLVDDFNRASLMLDPEMEVAPGGEFGKPNTDGGVVYWISWNDATNPTITPEGVLKLTATGGGWYGTASDMAFTDEYNCIAFRIKGENGGEEKLLTFNPDTQGAKTFAELKDPYGEPVPPITKEWQTIVIGFAESGWKGLADGKESYQNIHLNTEGALTVYIDEIYFTAVNLEADLVPQEQVGDDSQAATQVEDTAVSQQAADTANAQAAQTPAPQAPAKTSGNAGRIVIVIVLAVVVVGAITAAVILLTKKPRDKQ